MTIIVYFGRPRRVSFLRSVESNPSLEWVGHSQSASQPANGMQTHTFYLKAAATTPINIVSLFSVSADGERIKVLARLVYITRVVMDGPSHAGTHASRVNTINNSFVFCKLTLIKIRRVREWGRGERRVQRGAWNATSIAPETLRPPTSTFAWLLNYLAHCMMLWYGLLQTHTSFITLCRSTHVGTEVYMSWLLNNTWLLEKGSQRLFCRYDLC
jgi:hypothetical protein